MMLYNYIQRYEVASYNILFVQHRVASDGESELTYYIAHPSARMPDIKVWVRRLIAVVPRCKHELYVCTTVLNSSVQRNGFHMHSGFHLVGTAREYLEDKFTALAEGFFRCTSAIDATQMMGSPLDVRTPGLIT